MKLNRVATTVVLIGALLLTGCMTPTGKEMEVTKEQIIPIRAAQVSKGTIAEEYTFTTKAKGIVENEVIPELPGKVTKVYYDIGDKVRQGATLYEIDYDLSQVEQQITQVKQAKESAEIGYNDAKDNYEKITSMYNEGVVSKAQFDQAKSLFENAQIGFNTASNSYNLAMESYGNTKDKKAVKSPASGVVGGVYIKEGNLAAPGSPAFTIADLSKIQLTVGVSEEIVGKIHVGDSVDIKISSLEEGQFSGSVTAVSPVANPMTSKYDIKIIVDNQDNKIYSGMFAEVTFKTTIKEDVLLIPQELLNYTGMDCYVYIVEEGIVKEVYVETGLENRKSIEIVSGLVESDRIIVEGYHKVKQGSLVKEIEE
ncbi:MAG: efflux RND transporter periplasmic adaptor subunit [Peptostreptococcales bacterium]